MIIDIIIIAVIALCTFIGYKKGLIKVAVNILGFFIALIIAFVLYNPVASFIINNTQIDETIEQKIIASFSQENKTEEEQKEVENNSQIITDYINGYIEEYKNQGITYAAKNVSIIMVKIGSGLVVFLISKFILLFLKLFADAIANLPIIKQFNKAGGTIYGILEGFLIVYVVLGIISIASPMISDSKIITDIQNSYIGNTMYDNNIVLKILF